MNTYETLAARRWLAWLLVLVMLIFALVRGMELRWNGSPPEPPGRPGLVASG